MRLVLLNPHVNFCGKMVFNWLFKFPHHHKYNFLWQAYIKNLNKKISFLVDGSQSSFYQTSYFQKTIGRNAFLKRIFTFFEFWIWIVLNRIHPFQFKTYFNAKQLDPKKHILFTFGFTSLQSQLSEYDGLVLVHLSHYHIHTEEISAYFKGLKHGFLVAENDLSHNPYFKHHFPAVKSVYQLPLALVPGRFKKVKPFKDRINKCFASGSASFPSTRSYTNYYGNAVALNSMRETIYNNKKELKDLIEAYIYPSHNVYEELKTIQTSDGVLKKCSKKYLPLWMTKLFFNYQLPYFRFDIVEKYNEYRMFMSPEERTGLPSMKMFEGMLCGSVLVGIDDPMYTNIGFKDGVNYIAYRENDLEDLKRKIRHYQHHPRELEQIAERAYDFANSFTPEHVASLFWRDLERLADSFKSGDPLFKCSFRKA